MGECARRKPKISGNKIVHGVAVQRACVLVGDGNLASTFLVATIVKYKNGESGPPFLWACGAGQFGAEVLWEIFATEHRQSYTARLVHAHRVDRDLEDAASTSEAS